MPNDLTPVGTLIAPTGFYGQGPVGPTGEPGPPGTTGDIGPTGPPGTAGGFTRTVAPFTVPDVGDAVVIELEDAQWIPPEVILMIAGVSYLVEEVEGNFVTLRHVEERYVTPGPTGPEGPPGRDGYPLAAEIMGFDAATGEVGEYRESVVTTPVTFATGLVASLTLPAGDWHVWANVSFVNNATYNGTLRAGISTTNVVPDNLYCAAFSNGSHGNAALAAGAVTGLSPPARRFNFVAANTTVNLALSSSVSVMCSSTGFIAARRVR